MGQGDIQPSSAQIAWKNIKENPIKSLTGIIVIISFIFGSVFWVDNRYVHAGALTTYQIKQEKKEIKRLENLIFETNLKEQEGSATNIEKTMKIRYQEQVKDMKQNVRDMGGKID